MSSASSAAVPHGERTVVAEPAWVWVLVFTALPALGAGAGWLLVAGAEWISELPFLPFDFVLRAVDGAPQPLTTVLAAGVGAVAGLLMGIAGWEERLTVVVSQEGVTLRRGRSSRTVVRGDVAGAFADGKQLVLLARDGGEAAREPSDLSAGALRDALVSRGYRWYPDGDPYADQFSRWVEGMPDLPPPADALLRARQKALEKNDKRELADLLRELALHGVVVRDEDKRQFTRLVTRPER
jgi:hypothetical protein